MKKIVCFLLLLFVIFIASAFDIESSLKVLFDENIEYVSYDKLFQSYKERDVTIAQLRLQLDKATNMLAQTRLQKGFDMNLSTGESSATFSPDGTSLSFNPNVSLSLPFASNLTISGSVPVNVEVSGSENETTITGSSVTVSADIISSVAQNLTIQEENAIRALYDARQNYLQQEYALEKEFINEIKSLYTYAHNVLLAQNTLYDAQLEFDLVKTQGFSQVSATYRSKQVAVQTAQFDLDDKNLLFKSELRKFMFKSGFQNPVMVADIPKDDLLDFTEFDQGAFSQLESASWKHYLAQLQRKAQKSFTLTGNGGYQYKDRSNVGAAIDSEHHALAGLQAQYRGFSVGAGVSVPVNKPERVSSTFSLGWNFQNTFADKYKEKNLDLGIELEELSIKGALEQYDIVKDERIQTRENLLWKLSVQTEHVEIYKDYLQQSTLWFDRGLISVTQFNQAKRDYSTALITLISTQLSCLIYNFETKSFFVVK
ncbi:MAG: hypothetical protein ACRC4W_01820 [Treponemataceae bacterium]